MPTFKLALLAMAMAVGIAPAAHADPSLAPFYQSVSRMKAEGRLGQVLAREQVATPIPGAVAWRIAYVSSDMADNKTIATGLVIAPLTWALVIKYPAGARLVHRMPRPTAPSLRRETV